MGRKKKIITSSPVVTRKTRQSAKAGTLSTAEVSSTADNSLDSEAGSASQDASGENDSQDSNNLNNPSTHKHFGKFRCLVSKYPHLANAEVSGTDSETGSNVEVRVVDPCASSESDGSNHLESFMNPSTSTAPQLKSFGRRRNSKSIDLRKTMQLKLLENMNSSDSNTFDSDNLINLDKTSYDTQIPDPTLGLMVNNDPRYGFKMMSDDSNSIPDAYLLDVEETFPEEEEPAESQLMDENQEYTADDSIAEDEIVTVFEIIDDNAPQDDLNAEVASYSESGGFLSERSSPCLLYTSTRSSESDICDEIEEIPPLSLTALSSCTTFDDFELSLQKMKLLSNNDALCPSSESASMEYIDNNSNDTHLSKNDKELETLSGNTHTSETATPFPAPIEERKCESYLNVTESCSTPTSILSEEDIAPAHAKVENETANGESNETNLGCSTDSSSCSSASVIRRSNRIKTISVLKQRSKGHGLVKTPQKKLESPLAKQVFNKCSENANDSTSRTLSNSCPVSPSVSSTSTFSVPVTDAEMRPVKVKSRWRRSSEMEMGSRSPVTPPLNSPNGNFNKLSTIGENTNSLSFKTNFSSVDESSFKSDQWNDGERQQQDDDLQKRLKQFEIILENQYHCDRTISKEAKRMTCDCFLTKEEFERGELGCGEDCLNRLLMIEW